MKIRTDFVTNSSSVSFIITMNLKIVDVYEKLYLNIEDYNEINIIRNELKLFMLENGTRTFLEGEEIFIKKIEFADDGGYTLDNNMLNEENRKLNFQNIDEDELWNYIRGEYIYNGNINKINGFGTTQVETY